MRRHRRFVAAAMIGGTALAAGIVVVVPGRPAGAIPNPTISDSCGVDVTLVLDASGSISSSNAVEQVRDAAEAFLDALSDTNSTARVTQFATVSEQLAPSTLVDGTSLGPGGTLTGAISGYYDPKPPRPSGVDFYDWRGGSSGNPQNSGNWRVSNGSNQYTNWDQGLDQAAEAPGELVVFVTDGDPTAYDFNQSGDPFSAGPPPDVGFNTGSGATASTTLARAVEEADRIKGSGARVLSVGVGNALGNEASVNRLIAVSGPQVVRDAGLAVIDSLNEVDVALVTDFDDLADFLRSVVLQLCSPSLTIRKLAQSAGNSDYLPAPGWEITATPSVPGGTFEWILPETAAGASWTLDTDANGFVQFQWEPDPPEADSAANVAEVLQPGYTAGRPGVDDDFRCALRDEDGNVRVVEGDFDGGTTDFDIDPIGQEIVTCTIWNSFAYDPEIAITKVNAPTAVRGDLDPAATVTSSYAVTNLGNTPLGNVRVTDDKCAPVAAVPATGPNVGDANTDGRLDVPETWQFTCTRSISASQDPGTVVNEATVTGTDPSGTTVTASATDDIDVYVPRITLTKLVNGAEQATIEPPAAASYTYAVTNTGNAPLGTVTLVDDTPPCTSPTPDAANTSPPLLPGQTWNYSCTAAPTSAVINTATVTGTPLNPAAGNAPFPAPNPVVTATDFAEVDVINPNIDLVKSVTPDLLLLDPVTGAAQPVTYTFAATNTGTPTLNRPGATTAGPAKEPGWLVDLRCTTPATYVSGDDAPANDLLDPDETWTFTCPGLVDETTVNVAAIAGQPSGPDGVPVPGADPVTDLATAIVRVVEPGIAIVKTALVPVVLDGDATPIAGPDVPDPRPAEYGYDVTNTGNVELSLGPEAPVDDLCGPLVFVEGDADGDELLDPDETWVYTCEVPLDRDDANTPPVSGDESGLVQNTANVSGVPSFEGALFPDAAVTASDIAQVLVIEPGISLTKTASAPVVLLGDDVTYSFVVTNTGDVGLDVLGPIDDTCSPLTFTGGDTNDNGLLDGADSGGQESWTFTCTATPGLPAPPATTDINAAAVLGIDPLGNVYEADATAEVRVFDPAIDLVKTVDETLVPTGTEVTYGFEVTNVGGSPLAADDVLADIGLVDLSLPPVPSCLLPTFVGGDTNDNDLLEREPAEVWTYTCSAVITEPTTDVAVVDGTGGALFQPPLPVDVFDVDAVFVQTFTPAIEITKSAAPTELVGGGPVTYNYLVRNTGDVPLADVVDRIVDDTCSPVTYVSGDEDGDDLLDTPNSIFEDSLDETWTFTCTVEVTETTTNTVVVEGTPTDPGGEPLCGGDDDGEPVVAQIIEPCDATSEDTAVVTVVDPGTITIIKRTPTPTTATFDFTVEPPPGRDPEGTSPCDPSYPTICIPPPPPDLDCVDISARGFTVRPPDPHGFDADGDGIGCESDEPFALRRDESRTFADVVPGTYTVTESTRSGWRLAALACTDPTNDSVVTVTERRAVITVAPGETVVCTFTNRPIGRLPATGNDALALILLIGGGLAGAGAALVLTARKLRSSRP